MAGSPIDSLVRGIAHRYTVSFDQVVAIPSQGVANLTYSLGADLVLRVARPGFADDLARELIAIPFAIAAGVVAPVIVEHGQDGAGQPYLVQNRCAGVLLADVDEAVAAAAYNELGHLLARLHRADVSQLGTLRRAPLSDPTEVVDELGEFGWISGTDVAWLRDWFVRLAGLGGRSPEPALLHGDASPSNVLVDPANGRVTGLLDWGDAALGDPAFDLAKIPPRHLPSTIAGYAHGADTVPWAARALTHQLHWALGRLLTDPRRADSTWSAPPASRLVGLLRLTAHLPAEWAALLPAA